MKRGANITLLIWILKPMNTNSKCSHHSLLEKLSLGMKSEKVYSRLHL